MTPRSLVPLSTIGNELVGSPRFVSALSLCSIGTAVLARAIERTIGFAGLTAMLSALVILAALSLVARRDSLQWQGLLPLSLLGFFGWASISILWSQYQWASLGGLAYLLAYSFLGVYIAVLRDLIQIVRAFGDVLRLVLAVSLGLEIFSGVLIDMPIAFLGIQGRLAELGPIQGLLGNRNQLALVALLAAITFGTELRTRSVNRFTGVVSLALAAVMLALSRSVVIGGVLLLALAATAALYAVRRVPAASRTYWQLGLLTVAAIGGGIAWFLRSRIVGLFNASGDLDQRLDLWHQISLIAAPHTLEGWGWIGRWRTDIPPYNVFVGPTAAAPTSALNAFADLWLQIGLIGAAIFTGVLGFAFVRSWLLAGRRRSIVFAWPAIVLVALVGAAFFESWVVVEYSWLLFVVCCIKAARELSWRRAFSPRLEPELE